MPADRYILDYKAYMPRMRRFRKKLDPEIAPWRKLKEAVHGDGDVEWSEVLKRFRVGNLVGPNALGPASREAHRDLKGMYAFFQHGYVLRARDYVGLHARVEQRQRLTTGHSIVVSSTPATFGDHTGGMRKLESHTECALGSPATVPFAIGYSELHREGKVRYPAYFWLLHEVECGADLAKRKTRRARPDRDSFVGMKNIAALYEGRVRCDGSAARVTGAFDEVLIEMLATERDNVVGPHAAIRRLRRAEIGTIPSEKFKTRDEKLRRRLNGLGLIHRAALSGFVARETIDWARRTDWVQDNWTEINDLVVRIVKVGASYF